MTTSFWALAAILLLPTCIFCLECWLAMLPRSCRRTPLTSRTPLPSRPMLASRPPVLILIPARDEEEILAITLDHLNPQLMPGDRVLVVADNCTDRTALIARANGADVVERSDPHRHGKGYALHHGLQSADPSYEVVVILDADCTIEKDALDALIRQAHATQLPAQAAYLIDGRSATPRAAVSAWAFMVKNLVRPSGLARLRLPCQLTGTGMAFPRSVLAQANLGSGNIVEDLQLGLDLALLGYPPQLCPEARVTGWLPADSAIALRQRERWEHGHLRTLLVQSPRLLVLGMMRRRAGAIALGLDLMVPPLSLLLILLLLACLAFSVTAALDRAPWEPAAVVGSAMLIVMATVLVVWLKFGQRSIPAHSLLCVTSYVLWKAPMYAMFFIRPQKAWVRTPRTSRPDAAKSAA